MNHETNTSEGVKNELNPRGGRRTTITVFSEDCVLKHLRRELRGDEIAFTSSISMLLVDGQLFWSATSPIMISYLLH